MGRGEINDIFTPLKNISAGQLYDMRVSIIHHIALKKSLALLSYCTTHPQSTPEDCAWTWTYRALGFCCGLHHSDLGTRGLLTTGRPYISGGLLVSKGGGSLLSTRGGATIKDAAAYLSCTRPHSAWSSIPFSSCDQRSGGTELRNSPNSWGEVA